LSGSRLSANEPAAAGDGTGRIAPAEVALLASVFLIAACGLVYELAAGALASYLLGDSVTQFSTVIGTYLFAMGVGSWLSRYLERQLVAHFPPTSPTSSSMRRNCATSCRCTKRLNHEPMPMANR